MSVYFIVLLLLLVSAVHALDTQGNPTSFQDLLDNVQTLDKRLQLGASSVPGSLQSLFGGQTIHAKITRTNGNVEELTVPVKAGVVQGISKGAPAAPTVILESTESIIDAILQAPSVSKAFSDALNKGDVKLRGLGFGNRVRIGGFRVFSRFSGFFGGLFKSKQQLVCGKNICLNAAATDPCVRFSCGGNIQTEPLCPGTQFHQELCPILKCGNNVCVGAPVGAKCVQYSCGGNIQTSLLCPGTPFEREQCPTLKCGNTLCVGAGVGDTCVQFSCGGAQKTQPVCPGTPFAQAMCR